MKFPSLQIRRRRLSGSVTLLALVVTGMATLGLAAWVSVLAVRGQVVEDQILVVQRRVAAENAKQLSREYFYNNIMIANSGSAASVTLPNSQGTVSMPAWTESPMASTTLSGGVNRFGPGYDRGYISEHTVTTTLKVDHDRDGGAVTSEVDLVLSHNYQVKSRCPMLAGDLVTIHGRLDYPSSSFGLALPGGVVVDGRAVFWNAIPDNDVTGLWNVSTLYAEDVLQPEISAGSGTVLDLSSNTLLPGNFPVVPSTTGNNYGRFLSSGASGPSAVWTNMLGKLASLSKVVVDGAVESNERGVDSNGSGVVTIDLKSPYLTNVHLQQNVTELVLLGQDDATDYANAGNLIAIMVIGELAVNGADPTQNFVRLQHNNNRRLSLNLRVTGTERVTVLDWQAAASTSTWRLLLHYEGATSCKNVFTPDKAVGIQGGIRGEGPFFSTQTGSSVTFVREYDPKFLERLAGRTAWLESYPN